MGNDKRRVLAAARAALRVVAKPQTRVDYILFLLYNYFYLT